MLLCALEPSQGPGHSRARCVNGRAARDHRNFARVRRPSSSRKRWRLARSRLIRAAISHASRASASRCHAPRGAPHGRGDCARV